MSRSTLLLLAAPILLAAVLILSWPSAQTQVDEDSYSAIFWAADYLVSRQNEDGGWALGDSVGTTRGSRAVVGRSLLYAHQVTGSEKHLAAALRAARSLGEELVKDPESCMAMDGVFLGEIGEATGNPQFRAAARTVHMIRRHRFGWGDGGAAAEFFRQSRVPEKSDPVLHRNVAIWRAMDDIQLAHRVGETNFAEEMAGRLIKGVELDPGHPGGALAAGRAVEVLSILPSRSFEPRLEEWLGRLARAQALPGIVGDLNPAEYVQVQDASHVLRAFASSRDMEHWEAARAGSGFFIDRQLLGANGSWESVLTIATEHTGPSSGPAGITADVLLALSRARSSGVRSAQWSF